MGQQQRHHSEVRESITVDDLCLSKGYPRLREDEGEKKLRVHMAIGNMTGNPGVFQGNLHLYPRKPTPAYTGAGFCRYGLRVLL